jgi:Na+/alanine symporter
MPGFSIHVFVFRFSKILATFLVDEKKVQLLIKEKLITLVLKEKYFSMEKKWYYCWDMIDCGWLGFGDFVYF